MKNVTLKLSSAALLATSLTFMPTHASAVDLPSTTTSSTCEVNKITGDFSLLGVAETTLDETGKITNIDFTRTLAIMANGSFATRNINTLIDDSLNSNLTGSNVMMNSSLDLNNIAGQVLWTAAGFTFTANQVIQNNTRSPGFTTLEIIGVVSHPAFVDTQLKFALSSQGMDNGATYIRSFSASTQSF